MWYHVSTEYLGKKVWMSPQIPKIDSRGQAELEGNIPRICVAPSIFQCLRAKYGYNHVCSISFEDCEENPSVYFTEEKPMIPPACTDYRSNDERWFLDNTYFYYLGRVDLWKLFTQNVIEPSKSPKVRLPLKLTKIYNAEENFIKKLLTSKK